MKKILNNFEKVFIIFLYLQPLLDLVAGLLLNSSINLPISSIVRFIFMFMCIIYLLYVIKNKKVNIYLISLLCYFLLFIIGTLYFKGADTLKYEIKNLLTTYYFILLLLALINLYRNSKFNIRHLLIIYNIYLILVFIPNILNIGFNSYWHSKEGHVGWFVSANVVGSILSIILPIILITIKKIDIKIIILSIINLYVIFSIGTKVPVLSFILVIIVNTLYYMKTILKKYKYIILFPILLVTFLTIIIFPKTSFYRNIIIHVDYLQEKYNNKIGINEFINHIVFSERLTFEKITRKNYEKSSIPQKIIGIGYIENYATDNVRIKTIEIDYFDIFYRHGVLGFIIFFIPIVYVIKSIIIDFKNKENKLNIAISLFLIITLAYFQGHIFVTPANSIYVALILSIVFNNSMYIKTIS